MNVDSWLRTAKTRIDSLDAELILLNVVGEDDRSFLVSHSDFELSDENFEKANDMLKRREIGEPLAYILGYKEFFGRKFIVSPDVLIPRVESEDIIDVVRNLKLRSGRILDVGTGSGCLAVSLALEFPKFDICAVDISRRALCVAKKNAGKFNVNIKFIESNLLDSVEGEFDVIVANLPYVDRKWSWLDFESLKFEPDLALFAQDGGLELIFRLICSSRNQCSFLVLEADLCQHEKIINFSLKHGWKLVNKQRYILTFLR